MRPYNQYIGFNDLWLRVFGIPVLGFCIPLIFFGLEYNSFKDYYPKWVEAGIFALVYWEGSRLIVIRLRKKHLSFSATRKRIIQQAICSLTYMFIIGIPLGQGLDQLGICPDHQPTAFQIMGVNITTSFLFLSIYESIYFYDQLKLSIMEQERLKQESIRSQLEGLRNQVNPHFLFNSLNTLMSLVEEDQKLAISFLKRLSKVYRYILDIREKKLVSLSEELKFIHSYTFLQSERFGESLDVQFDIPETLGPYKMVPLALQILFENAIKHNIISKSKPLRIQVSTKGDQYLVVKNNIQKKNQIMPSTKVGLENIRNRYRFFTNQQVVIEEKDEQFIVAIPLIKI